MGVNINMGFLNTMHKFEEHLTVAKLAEYLEARYEIVQKFVDLHWDQIGDLFLEGAVDYLITKNPMLIDGKIYMLWQDFINEEQHGLMPEAARLGKSSRHKVINPSTKKAKKDPRVRTPKSRTPFVDSGEYRDGFKTMIGED